MLPKTLMTDLTLRLYSLFEKICILRADKIVAVSENIRKYLIELGCSSQKLEIVPVFLDALFKETDSTKLEQTRRALKLNGEHFVLTYVGRISKEKNLEVLIKAFQELDISVRKNSKLLIVGEGEQLSNLKSSTCFSNGIMFPGHRTDVREILYLSDVFVLPSLTEGFPLSLLEAMSSRKAIVASNIPAIKQILDDEEDAILFDPRKSEQLKMAILRLYRDPKLRRELGENAEKKASKYRIDAIYPKILRLYFKSLKRETARAIS
jgi:glycosyltransferase involved in cell wall biosynthesis